MANIDSVKYGTTVANLTGTHLANDWSDTHKIHQAETHALKEFLANINKKYQIHTVINLTTEH